MVSYNLGPRDLLLVVFLMVSEANTKQSNLLENTLEFNKSDQEPK